MFKYPESESILSFSDSLTCGWINTQALLAGDVEKLWVRGSCGVERVLPGFPKPCAICSHASAVSGVEPSEAREERMLGTLH